MIINLNLEGDWTLMSLYMYAKKSTKLWDVLCFETGQRKDMGLQVIIPGEKFIVEDPSRNGQTAGEEK